jgi:hypothetical protein
MRPTNSPPLGDCSRRISHRVVEYAVYLAVDTPYLSTPPGALRRGQEHNHYGEKHHGDDHEHHRLPQRPEPTVEIAEH